MHRVTRDACARPVIAAKAATDSGLRSRINARRHRLWGVSMRITASTELKLGLLHHVEASGLHGRRPSSLRGVRAASEFERASL
jgi:hypothetical protein